MNRETEYGHYRLALARKLAGQGKSPAQIRSALAASDEQAMQRKQQPQRKGKDAA